MRLDDTNPTKEDVEYVDSILMLSAGWALTGIMGVKSICITPVIILRTYISLQRY